MQHEALRLVRVFHDMNQTTLAERLGYSKAYISQIEGGSRPPGLELLKKYAETFSMPLSSLLFFAENIHTPTIRADISSKAIKMLQWIATMGSK